jgi:hypothetical protein
MIYSIGDQAFTLSYDLAPPPPPFLSFLVFLCVAGRAYGLEPGGGKGDGEEPIIRWRESLVLYK